MSAPRRRSGKLILLIAICALHRWLLAPRVGFDRAGLCLPTKPPDQARQLAPHPCETFLLRKGTRGTSSHDHVVVIGRKILGERPESLSKQPLDAIANHRRADPPANRYAEPWARGLLRVRRGGTTWPIFFAVWKPVQDEMATRSRATMTVDAVELCAARQPSPLLLGRHESDRQPRAALATPPLQHQAPGTRAHASSKPVRTGALALFRLIGPPHRLNFTWTGATLQATAASGQYRSWASRAQTERTDPPAQDCGLPVQTLTRLLRPFDPTPLQVLRGRILYRAKWAMPHRSSTSARFWPTGRCYNRASLEGSRLHLSNNICHRGGPIAQLMRDPHLEQTWTAIQSRLRDELPENVYRTWIARLKPVKLDRSALYLQAPDDIRDWVRRRFGSLLTAAADSVIPQLERVELVREDAGQLQADSRSAGATHPDSSGLDLSLTFDGFVIGDRSRFAHAAALAVAELPAAAYNPLLIHGPAGAGKTHLLNAIGHYVRLHSPELTVLYVTAENFTNQFVAALRKDDLGDFKRTYRSADVLLLDDVDFIAGKRRTSEELAHTLDALLTASAQLVVTASHPLALTTALNDRTGERLRSGLTVDIDNPDLASRLVILRKLVKQQAQLQLDADVLELLAVRAGGNTRALRAALTRHLAFTSLTATIPSLATAQQLFDQLGSENLQASSRALSVTHIQQAVCLMLEVEPNDMISPRRNRPLVYARQIAMYLSRELTRLSLPAIAASFGGRDHTTVLHAHRKIKHAAQTDPQLRTLLSAITGKLTAFPLASTQSNAHPEHHR
jgi:chromosomal replication initiator protein